VSVVAVLLLLVAIGLLWRPWQRPQSNTTAISSSNAPTTSTPTRTMTAAAPSPVAPPPVTVTAPTTSTAQVQTGPTIGDECDDWMKFSTDPLSGQEMLCSGYPDNLSRGEPMKWYSAEAGAVGPSSGWADAPRVGKTGSSCSGEVPYTMGRSSDGYAVWCVGDGALARIPCGPRTAPRRCLTLAPIGSSHGDGRLQAAPVTIRLEIDDFRESRKSVAIGRLTWALCDILCECPRGAGLRGS
jgi:hypothetical protein